MASDLHHLRPSLTPGIKTRRALHRSSTPGRANSDALPASPPVSKPAAISASEPMIAIPDMEYRQIKSGPLTSADGDSDALAPSRGILLAAVIGAILYAVIWMLWPAR